MQSVVVSVAQPSILVGATTQASAKLLDSDGHELPDQTPTWVSVTPTIVSVSEQGAVTGLQAGTGQVRAFGGKAFSTASVQVRNPVARSIQLAQSTASIQLPGGTFQVIAAVTDELGRPMLNPAITWATQQPLVASVNVAGLVTGLASGNATITATIDGVAASLLATVRPATAAGAPSIIAVAPATLRPGGTFVLTGTNFGASTAANQVLVDGVPATVQAASATQMTVVLPSSGFTCEPTRDAQLQVTAGGLIGARSTPLQTGNRRVLGVGQSVVVADAEEVRCNELVPGNGRWIVSIYNASKLPVSPTALASASFQIRGVSGAPLVAASKAEPTTAQSASPRRDPAASAHLDLLERNVAALRGRRVAPVAALSGAGPGGPSQALTTTGSVTTVRIPNLDAPDLCVSNFPVNARTVFVGPHSVIVEDTVGVFNGKTTLRGQMDDYFTRLGNEFEQEMWGIVNDVFGNPLAMDAQLSNIGRVVMVFSPRVNAMRAGAVNGFVANCDFFPVGSKPSSNGGAFFYASVPASFGTGYSAPETRDHWMRLVRSTVIHEVKHIASFAERLSRNLAAEDVSWEEGTARIAEEIYARRIYGTQPLANTTYALSIGCDIRYALVAPPCADRPLLMLRHFDGLFSYLGAPEIFSPLGRANSFDVNFYAGAWSFLRWASENVGASETQFFHDFAVAPVTGVLNVEARTGRRWEELLGEWSLAAYLDDVGGFAPENTRLRMRSWNHPDIWHGLCDDLGPCVDASNPVQSYPRSTPFAPRERSFGNFSFIIGALIGGGVSYLDLDGPGSAAQAIEIKAASGPGDAPSTVRIAFVRVR